MFCFSPHDKSLREVQNPPNRARLKDETDFIYCVGLKLGAKTAAWSQLTGRATM
jgi:hypothetical protein